MRKGNYRDYAVEAFRYYAMCGKPSITELNLAKSIIEPSEKHKRIAGLADLEAVNRVLYFLESEHDGQRMFKCLDEVYFANPMYYPKRGSLTQRVVIAAETMNVSESYIYRALRKIRLMFALERGLRTNEDEVELVRTARHTAATLGTMNMRLPPRS